MVSFLLQTRCSVTLSVAESDTEGSGFVQTAEKAPQTAQSQLHIQAEVTAESVISAQSYREGNEYEMRRSRTLLGLLVWVRVMFLLQSHFQLLFQVQSERVLGYVQTAGKAPADCTRTASFTG